MGFEIHMFAEKRVEGVWVFAQADDLETDPASFWFGDIKIGKELYQYDNPEFFSMLGAPPGLFRGHGIKSIAPLRGAPENASGFIREKSRGPDRHYRNYFTLRELKEFDWKGHTYELKAWLTPEQARAYRESGALPETMRVAILDMTPPGFETVAIRRAYADEARGFFKNVVPLLESYGGDDDVRIIFWWTT